MRADLRSVFIAVIACGLAVQISAQTTLPGVPVQFTGGATGTLLTLSWGQPTEGAPILTYLLEMGIQSGVYDAIIPVGTLTSISGEVDPGTYYFRVRAQNAVGVGPPTEEVAINVVAGTGLPGPPEDVTATVNGSSVTFSWSAPLTGASVSDYFAWFGTAPGVYIASASVGMLTSVTLTLPDGVYFFKVAARNAVGLGPPSSEVVAVVGTALVPPGPPQNLAAVASLGQLTFTWSPPVEGAPITNYILEIGPTSGEYPYVMPLGPVTSFSLTGVSSGTLYFRVTAENALGQGPPSDEVGVRIGGPQTPSPPRNVTATSSGSTLTFAWAAPTFGPPILGYAVDIGLESGVYIYSAPVGPLTTVSFPNAPIGVYFFRVTAYNAHGVGQPSSEIAAIVGTALVPPGPPQNLAAVASSGQLTFRWTVPAEGAPITNYILEVGPASGVYPFVVQVGPATTYRLAGAVGSEVYFRVTAVNALGQGPPSDEVGVRVGGPQTPSPPRNVTATSSGSTVTFAWAVPTFGSPILGYTVDIGLETGVYIYSGPVGLVTTVSFPNAPIGVYFFRVTAHNGHGAGTPSEEITVVVGTPVTLPGPPQDLVAVPAFRDLIFRWSAPAEGTPITNYILELGPASGVYPYVVQLGPATTYRLAGVGGPEFYFRVTAVNALGQGPPSEESALNVNGPQTPSAPRNTTATVAGGFVTFRWSPPTFGAPIIGYRLEFGTPQLGYFASGDVGPITSFTFQVPDGLYLFRVTARNAHGLGTPGSEVVFYSGPPCTTPAAPALTGSVSGSTLTLSWTTPSGGPITDYSITVATQAGGPVETIGNLGLVNTISGTVGSGTYFLRVRAHALCGPGAPSNLVSLTVP